LKEPNRKFLVFISLQKTISVTLFSGLHVVRREAEAWLRQAERDLRKAINDLKTQDWDSAAFWSQQSAEKLSRHY